ncbi:MAG TPA: hypothetical protein PKZ76_03445 [Xanthomonadaceae bacterium]|nr:hypothetical protein [Xanthomonadaceae bacterium]
MPRTKRPAPDLSPIDNAIDDNALAKAHAETDQMRSVLAQFTPELINHYINIGAARQAAQAAKVHNAQCAATLKQIKDTRSYRLARGLRLALPNGSEIVHDGSWETECAVHGISRQHADRQIALIEDLGEEFLDAVQTLGVSYRQLNRLRTLPEPEREVLIEGVRAHAGDAETIQELITETLARKQQEIERVSAELEREREEHAEEKAADEQIIREKDERINKLMRDKRKAGKSPLRDQVADLLHDMDTMAVEAGSNLVRLGELATEIEHTYAEAGEPVPADILERIDGNRGFVANWLRTILGQLGEA